MATRAATPDHKPERSRIGDPSRDSFRVAFRKAATAGIRSALPATESVPSWIHSSTAAIVRCFRLAAKAFFDRPAPEGYLADWSRWLAVSTEGQSRGRAMDEIPSIHPLCMGRQ